ncbi:hypothetical protein GQ55_2G008700 [Panicum hallii var. hallii]|uniref:Uncharacterized protein n=1 Tax=Panicum hallii var. hallii TaxID=1504633 RepID=A0A2T7EK75_9POAL|nr:hypothetical protein GQ55_2G008700 [Panicum hallii var. hallii]
MPLLTSHIAWSSAPTPIRPPSDLSCNREQMAGLLHQELIHQHKDVDRCQQKGSNGAWSSSIEHLHVWLPPISVLGWFIKESRK